jgi:TolA-binding protein
MKNSVFLIFMLLLFSGLVLTHAMFREEVGPERQLRVRNDVLEREKQEAEFKSELAEHRLNDFQQQVATLLPNSLKGKKTEEGYQLRQLASVVTVSDTLGLEHASGLLEKAKQDFRAKNYEQCNSELRDLIRRYPDSVHVVEAYFLLAEGQFQVGELEASIATIDHMITLYPDNDLTGFALLRLGKIFEKEDRLEDATDIYRSILANFKRPEITSQAQVSLKAVAL